MTTTSTDDVSIVQYAIVKGGNSLGHHTEVTVEHFETTLTSNNNGQVIISTTIDSANGSEPHPTIEDTTNEK